LKQKKMSKKTLLLRVALRWACKNRGGKEKEKRIIRTSARGRRKRKGRYTEG